MSIFRAPKYKPKAPKAPQPTKSQKSDKSAARALTSKSSSGTPKISAVSDKDIDTVEDDAIANLKRDYAKVEAEKRESSYVDKCDISMDPGLTSFSSILIDGILPAKVPKPKPGKGKLLGPQSGAPARSHPGSPAIVPLASPSLGPTSNPAQTDKAKQQWFPIIHELAVKDRSYSYLEERFDGNQDEFMKAMNKVADFIEESQKWTLKGRYWKELDVHDYDYDPMEDRQKAIDNAVKQYDRMRIGVLDPLWQNLLPRTERNKGIYLSKVQAAITNKSAVPKINVSKTDASSVSGADSERDDSTSSTTKKGKGGEPMSRSNSQTLKKKPSPSEAQAKRLLSNSKKPGAASTPKASPKVSPTKPTAAAKAPGPKNPRVKSKEFVSDSDSDDDEVPLSASLSKSKITAAKPLERVAERVKVAEKTKTTEKVKELPAQKPKSTLAARPAAKEKDTIRAVRAPAPASAPIPAPASAPATKPVKAPAKRRREPEEDDSSSSGAPLLSKRLKSGAKVQAATAGPTKQRAASDASQNSRATSSGASGAKSKNSPPKSSPLASSPPTNASELEQERQATVRDLGRGWEREREHDRGTIVSRAGSSASSSASSVAGKKRPADDTPSPASKAKRQRLSDDILNKANKFKQFYTRYEALHREIQALEDPSPARVADLVEMRERLVEMKTEIYRDAPVEA